MGRTINVDFREGEVNTFVASGRPKYDDSGVSFSVVSQGDSPQLMSAFHIMFGRVAVTMKAAPGQGIVSSVVLQSSSLDEIDFEWLGTDDAQVQTNYFGKGVVSTYNRGQFNPAKNNQAEFHTYTIDWTKDRILWAVDETEVRTQTADEAEDDQYPQSPMQIKFGSWAGGDPRNPQGTIDWAGGKTNYADGPYTMVVQSISVSDYSTGKEYRYTDNSGSWESIEAVDGEVNGNEGNVDAMVISGSAPAQAPTATQGPQIPAGGIATAEGEATITQTGWPWDPEATPDYDDAPDGWIITEEGKLVPAGSGSALKPSLAVLGSLLLGVVAFLGHAA